MGDDETLAKATAEANELFERMRQTVEARVEKGVRELDVLEVVRESGLEGVDERTLAELEIPRIIYPHSPWLPYHVWWPWRPLWCWWWHWRYPWYRCCPYWWWRCHPFVLR